MRKWKKSSEGQTFAAIRATRSRINQVAIYLDVGSYQMSSEGCIIMRFLICQKVS
jgi:hypothetical protein